MLQHLADALARHPAVSHIVIGLGIQVVVAVALLVLRVRQAWWFGAACAIAFYFSRKKLEVEFHADPTGAHKAHTWILGWIPLAWPWRYQIQFYAPTIAVVAMALLATRLAGGKGRTR